MSFLKSLSEKSVLLDVFKQFPETSIPLLEYHERLMRGPSPLSVAERELLAAYVSGLNACHYCHGVHAATAQRFGVAEGLLAALLHDIEQADVAEKLKPLLEYSKKLTLTPAKLTKDDAEAVFAAGWDDQALHDAVSVCALFNFMNRLVEGLGIDADSEYFSLSSQRLTERGYSGLIKILQEGQS